MDTGAAFSVVKDLPIGVDPRDLGPSRPTAKGASGKTIHARQTKALTVAMGNQTFMHKFTWIPGCPYNLVGRDIMKTAEISVKCSADGIQVSLKGQIQPNTYQEGQYILYFDNQTTLDRSMAQIYWARCILDTENLVDFDPEMMLYGSVVSKFQEWKPYIDQLGAFVPPKDPYHCTLNYLRDPYEPYEEAWGKEMEGQTDHLKTGDIFVGKEGVMAEVMLPDKLQGWFETKDSAPHVTLLIKEGGEARRLSDMAMRVKTMTWLPTDVDHVWINETGDTHKLDSGAYTPVLFEMVNLDRDHGREHTNHPDAEAMMDGLPQSLWSTGPYDVGHVKGVRVTTVPNKEWDGRPARRAQYRLTPEKIEGIRPTIEGLLGAGVLKIVPKSRWNTPILPVLKADGVTYRMVHDLRDINRIVEKSPLQVPDPFKILQNVEAKHQYFSTIDLSNAYFCLDLDPDVQDMFSFQYDGNTYQYNRMPQGFVNSPGYFNATLKRLLKDLELPEGCILIEYVDDLLLACETAEICLQASKTLMETVADLGFKISRQKAQICRRNVQFLGRMICSGSYAMTIKTKEAILAHDRPKTVRDMHSFLGLTNWSRSYVPDYVNLTAPLRKIMAEIGVREYTSQLVWTMEAEKAFQDTKNALAQAAARAHPNYQKPFYLDVAETDGIINAVLFQQQEGVGCTGRKILMYYSGKLDQVDQGKVACSRYLAALAKAIDKTAHIVMCYPLVVNTEHGVRAYMETKSFAFSSKKTENIQRQLTRPNLSFQTNLKNMANSMQTSGNHICSRRAEKESKLRQDLQREALEGDDIMTLFTDGHSHRAETGETIASYAVVEDMGGCFRTIDKGILPQPASAQSAELHALGQALKLAEGKRVNVFTDSAYSHAAVHIDAPQWIRRDFKTSQGGPIRHVSLVRNLCVNVMLPAEVAIMKCKGHDTGPFSQIKAGNNAADFAAKLAGGYLVTKPGILPLQPGRDDGDFAPSDFRRLPRDLRQGQPGYSGPTEIRHLPPDLRYWRPGDDFLPADIRQSRR